MSAPRELIPISLVAHHAFCPRRGSTAGIGVAIASALAADGAHVVVSGRNAERGKQAIATIESAGGHATFVAADLGQGLSAVRELAAAATHAAGGRLDLLVNNAALLIAPEPTAAFTEELIDEALSVNVKAAVLLNGMIPRDGPPRQRFHHQHRLDQRRARHSPVRPLRRHQGGDPFTHEVVGRRVRTERSPDQHRRPRSHPHRPGRRGSGPYRTDDRHVPLTPCRHPRGGRRRRSVPRQRRRLEHPTAPRSQSMADALPSRSSNNPVRHRGGPSRRTPGQAARPQPFAASCSATAVISSFT
jgi:hypothetical protein